MSASQNTKPTVTSKKVVQTEMTHTVHVVEQLEIRSVLSEESNDSAEEELHTAIPIELEPQPERGERKRSPESLLRLATRAITCVFTCPHCVAGFCLYHYFPRRADPN